MGPKRKKSRQNSQAPIASQSTPANQIRNNGNSNDTGISKRLSIDSMQPQKAHDSPNSTATSARGSWYGGSWRSKASPVAQVARESISVAGGATSESSAEDSAQRPALYMTPSFKKSRKSIPTIAEATRVNATGSNTEAARSKEKMPEVEEETEVQGVLSKTVTEQVGANPPLPPDPSKDGASIGSHQSKPSQEKAGWFGWWSRPDGFSEDGDKSKDAANAQGVVTEAGETPLPLSPQVTRTSDGRDPPASRPGGEADSQSDTTKVDNSGQNEMLQIDKPAESGRSWFGLWSASQNEQAKPQTQEQTQESQKAVRAVQNETEVAQSAKQIPAPEEPKTEAKDSNEDEVRPPSSGWAFWSKEKAKESRPSSSGADKQVGELAVADTPSQSHPEAAQFNAEREKAKRASRPSSVKDGKAGKSKADESVKNANNIKLKPEDGTKSTSTDNAKSMRPPTVDAIKFDVASGSTTPKLAKGQQSRPNLIIPSFQTTYPSAYIPTYWERFGLYVASSLRLAEYPPAPEHVSVAPTLPKVKNAIAIGVHGYFPAPLIQKVLGQPTGTSIRFANHASAAIRSWVEQHQPETPCEVEQVALEGEGYIADRVTTLWKLMLNWLSHLRKADLIYVACHSQGVPVAIMLVAKLIQLGCLNPTAKIGICAMAGVNLGPFADYKSRYIGGAAAELFEFSDSHSRVSRDYASSLEVVLRHGVRISYIGSIDDQLVSLEVSWQHCFLSHDQSLTYVVFTLQQPHPPVRPTRSICRWSTAHTRLHLTPRRVRPKTAQSRHQRSRPNTRT